MNTPFTIRTLLAAGMAVGVAATTIHAQVQSSPGTVVSRWSMDRSTGLDIFGNGSTLIDYTLDSRIAVGEGLNFGTGDAGFEPNVAADHLIVFNDRGSIGGTDNEFVSSTSVAPTSMYINGNTGGTSSYDAGSVAGIDGGLFFPADKYGNEFSFFDGFTLEMMFRTDGDQSGAGNMQLLGQANADVFAFPRYGLIANEGGDGNVRFFINDNAVGGAGIITLDMRSVSARNYADGEWHYLKAEYNNTGHTAADPGTMTLTISNEDGSSEQAFLDLPMGVSETLFQQFGFMTNDGNMMIGRSHFSQDPPPGGNGGDPRTFMGLIDEVQITAGSVSALDQFGAIGSTAHPNATGAVVARWSMDAGPVTSGGVPTTLDSRLAAGEGNQVGFNTTAATDNLWFLSGDNDGGAGSNPVSNYVTSATVAPSSMFDNGNSGGAASYDASELLNRGEGALFAARDQFGDEFSFSEAFNIEMMFKTDGDQSGAGRMQLLTQGEAFFRYGLSLNEGAPGEVTFALNDGDGTLPLIALGGGGTNYADGEWHYVNASFDPAAGLLGALTLIVTNEDGSFDEITLDIASDPNFNTFLGLDKAFDGVSAANDGNLLIGVETFGDAGTNIDPTSIFNGLIDEVQITGGITPAGARIGKIASGAGDFDRDFDIDATDIDAITAAILGSYDPEFDLTAEFVLDSADRDDLILNVIGTQFGDVNLDLVVDATDEGIVNANQGLFGLGWAGGDINGDGVTDALDLAFFGGLDGDLDGDGFVGINDLNIVLANWNQSVPPGDPLADPSGDGFVGIDDLNEVLGNWNAGTPPTANAAIPEPASVLLMGLGAATVLRRRK